MKVARVLSVLLLSLLSNAVVSQNDTMYVVQNGTITGKHAVSSYDSIVFYDPISIKFNDSILTDASGNTYTSVKIGTQEWMAENLRATKYSDGTVIPNVTDSAQWVSLTTGAWCHYNNDSQYDSVYGKLYNWYTVETGKLCPSGWHVPADADWTALDDYLAANGHSGTEPEALKATSGWGDHWYYNGTDDYGWNALPGGMFVKHPYRSFDGLGRDGFWWSSSQYDYITTSTYAFARVITAYNQYFFSAWEKERGHSIRCIKSAADTAASMYLIDSGIVIGKYTTSTIDSVVFYRPVMLPTLTTTISSIKGTSAVIGGDITNNGGGAVTSRGVCWGTSSNPTTGDNSTVNGSGTGIFTSNLSGLTRNTTYYVRAYAINSAGISYGNEMSFTTTNAVYGNGLTDASGNTYQSVIIGTQEWMAENLRTSKYADGTSIPNVKDGDLWADLDFGVGQGDTSQWDGNPLGAWCHYDNDSQYDSIYGKLYNWFAVGTEKLCPTGWHVPSYDEWTLLIDYLGVNGYENKESWALKSRSDWNGSDNYGWNGLPGGYRDDNGPFFYEGYRGRGMWWTSTPIYLTSAFHTRFADHYDWFNRIEMDKVYGFSVRCLKD